MSARDSSVEERPGLRAGAITRALRVGDLVACDDGLEVRVLGWQPRLERSDSGRPCRHADVVVELADGTRRLMLRRRIVALVEEPKR
jgi:hypothetical protein